ELNRVALKQSELYKHGTFAFVISLALSLLFSLNSYQSSTETWRPIFSILTLIYLVVSLYQLLLIFKLRRDLLSTGIVQSRTRRLALVQMLSIFTGYMFSARFAFRLLKSDGAIDYTFAF